MCLTFLAIQPICKVVMIPILPPKMTLMYVKLQQQHQMFRLL
jgi:hypothetical protein